MFKTVYEEETFANPQWPAGDLTDWEFSGCRFRAGNFRDYCFIRTTFSECRFEDCFFSNIAMDGCRFQNVVFQSCKILGVSFIRLSPFLLNWEFRDSRLELCNFSGLAMSQSKFIAAAIRECDFIDTDLRGVCFEDCDLQGSKFHHANLEKADFTQAHNYFIDPTANQLKHARFSCPEVLALLAGFGIEIKDWRTAEPPSVVRGFILGMANVAIIMIAVAGMCQIFQFIRRRNLAGFDGQTNKVYNLHMNVFQLILRRKKMIGIRKILQQFIHLAITRQIGFGKLAVMLFAV